MAGVPDVDATVRRIEAALEELGGTAEPLRVRAEEAIRLLMELYGAGLARIVEMVGRDTAERIAGDRLAGSLLLLHGLHPVSAEERIVRALGRLEQQLDGHRLTLREFTDGTARIFVSLNGSPPPPALASVIERAAAEAAPEITQVEIEGLPQPAVSLVQIAPAGTS